jgi:hypothetical protein
MDWTVVLAIFGAITGLLSTADLFYKFPTLQRSFERYDV